jgi:hypothetical protein
MTPNNLARVWAPNMMKTDSTNPMQLIQFTEQANILVTIMIQHAPQLFQVVRYNNKIKQNSIREKKHSIR